LWLPDLVSTPNAEVRLTFSPDGKRMLWGAIDWPEGRGSWDVYESRQTAAGWSKPVTVPFDSTAKEFDPSFAPDGSGVFFFSDRDGGSGKEDLYFAPFDPAKQQYQAAKNLGPVVNTPGEEWAPVLSRDGQRLLFTSDGHRGAGKHDLFIATRRGDAWVDVTNLAAVNSADDELDAAFLEDDRSIVFARGDVATTVDLYVAEFRDGKLQPAVRLSDAVNSTQAGVSTFGPAISAHDPGALYFTSRHTESRGRADIYRIGYRLGH
jgi:Tol biopolymer transport system component